LCIQKVINNDTMLWTFFTFFTWKVCSWTKDAFLVSWTPSTTPIKFNCWELIVLHK